MKNSRLVELYNSLIQSERRAFRKFVQSPFFNQREDVILLNDYLNKQYPFKRKNCLDRQVVFDRIFPNEAFDERKMDYTMSFLFQCLKSFLTYQEMKADEVNCRILLSRSLRKKNLPRIFEKETKETEKLLENQPLRNINYHYNRFQLHFEKYEFNSSQRRSDTTGFQILSDEMNRFFISHKLWQSCTAYSHKTVHQAEFKEDLAGEVLDLVESNEFLDSPSIQIFYHNYKALTEENSKPWFDKLRVLIRENSNQFSNEEMREFYIGTINYCIKLVNSGNKEFLNEAFELYQEGLKSEVFIDKGIISRNTYNNIAFSGLLLKEFEWVEQFIYDYKKYIEDRFRESTFNYNLANLYFRKPDYQQAMELLQRVEFDDVLHNLNARRMLLRIYFERKEIDALDSLLTSFKNYIYRHKELGGNHRNSYLNLIRYTSKLLTIKSLGKEGASQLIAEIEGTEPIAEKGWLLSVLQ